jgi:hypothetical protein
MICPSSSIIFRGLETWYQAGTHQLAPVEVSAGYRSIGMKAKKIGWPKGIADLFVGHLDISFDGTKHWLRMVTWHDDGADILDEATGEMLEYSFAQLFFSARVNDCTHTHTSIWVRGSFECRKSITTAITVERT